MKEVTLVATKRSLTGKGAARQARMAGNIPAIVYGPEIEPYSIEVSEKDLRASVKEASSTAALFDLNIDGKVSKVVIRDIQRDPVTLHVTHLDFHAISMNKQLHITVPITFVGEAKGVTIDGGILQTTMRDIEISCLPKDIPELIEVDVTELGIGESIHVRDLEIPDATILSEERRTVVVVAAPTVVKEPEPEEGEEVEGEGEAVEGEAAAEGETPAEGEAPPAEKK